MKKSATNPKPFKIHIGKYGGVRVDPEEFFADPEVQRKMKIMKDIDILGNKRDPKKQPAGESK